MSGVSGVHGAVVLDKPRGPTSFAAMRMAQRALGVRGAGHGGTLDPMASGVLVVLCGEATKLSALVMDHDKVYQAEVTFGVATDTLDAEGQVVAEAVVPAGALERARIEAVLAGQIGEVMQVPPRYSALKVDGKSHMSRARAGEDFEVKARPARCFGLRLGAIGERTVALEVHCGKGYYVRSLARDLGAALGLPAHLSALRRTRVGAFSIERAVAPEAVTPAHVIPIARMLPDLATLAVGPEDAAALGAGRTIAAPAGWSAAQALAVTADETPVALVAPGERGRLKVQRGFSWSAGE